MIDIKEIKKRIGKDEDYGSNKEYLGFRMDKTHSQKEENKKIDSHNELVLSIFSKELDKDKIKKRLDCWKGTMFFKEEPKDSPNEAIKYFGGWNTEDIIFWLIHFGNNVVQDKESIRKKLRKDIEISRKIPKDKRYKVLKRQKWRCNVCGKKLKFSKDSDWEGEVAHIDHIHPYTKRWSYPNGIENINELENLQALCPKHNKEKYNKIKEAKNGETV